MDGLLRFVQKDVEIGIKPQTKKNKLINKQGFLTVFTSSNPDAEYVFLGQFS